MSSPAPKTSFPALADPSTRLLILGSLPGEASLRRSEYYAHPTNQFWRLMEPVIDAPLVGAPYDERLERLHRAGVGLWDVIASARRTGSLDSDIRDPVANPLPELVRRLRDLRAVAFNGAKAFQLGRRQLRRSDPPQLIQLPSSSAAYCRIGFDAKAEAWSGLRAHLPR